MVDVSELVLPCCAVAVFARRAARLALIVLVSFSIFSSHARNLLIPLPQNAARCVVRPTTSLERTESETQTHKQ